MDKISDDDLLELFNLVSLDSDAEEEPFVLLSEDNGGQMRAEITALKKQVAELETRLVAVVQGKDAEIGALKARVDQVDQELAAQKKLIQELAAGNEKRVKKPKRNWHWQEWQDELCAERDDELTSLFRPAPNYYRNNQANEGYLKGLASARQIAARQGQSTPSPPAQRPSFDIFKPNNFEMNAVASQIANQRRLLRQQQRLEQQQRLALLVGNQMPLPVKKSPPPSTGATASVATATLASVSGGDASSGSATPNDGKKDVGEAMAIDDNKNEPKNLHQELAAGDEKPKRETAEEVWTRYNDAHAGVGRASYYNNSHSQWMGNYLKSMSLAQQGMQQSIDFLKAKVWEQCAPPPQPQRTNFGVFKPKLDMGLQQQEQIQRSLQQLLRENEEYRIGSHQMPPFPFKESPLPKPAAVATATLASVSGGDASSGNATPNDGKKDVGEAMAIDDNKNVPNNMTSAPTLQQDAMDQVNQLMASLKGPTSMEHQRQVLDTLKANPALMKAFIKQRTEKHFKPKKQEAVEDKNNNG